MKDLKNLKEPDIYSASMFILYKLIDIEEYSIIGELPYILDKTNLLNFCNYFGGQTIKVPTLNELYSIINIVLLYQYVNIDKIDYDTAINMLGYKQSELSKVKKTYLKVCDVLNNYKFGEL